MTVSRPSLSRRARYWLWSVVVEFIVLFGGAGTRPYFWALSHMHRQIDWRKP